VFLIQHDVAPLRAERDLDRVGELVDAAQNRRARLAALNYLLCHNLYLFLFKTGYDAPRMGLCRSILLTPEGLLAALLAAATARAGRRACALDDAENLVLAHDQQFFPVDLDLGTTVLAEQDPVARLH